MRFANTSPAQERLQKGFTLIELIVYIVVSAAALSGVLLVFQQATAKSSEAIVAKQALESAQALLEEIELMPYTWCDPTDPGAPNASSAAGCSTPQGLSPAPGKSRGSASSPFENVGDYGGYSASPPVDISGAALPGLANYRISVSLSNVAAGPAPSSDAIRVDVTVTGPSGAQTLTGYRLRHSPNALP